MATPVKRNDSNYVNKTIIKDKIYDQRILFHPTLKPEFCVEVGADGVTPVVPAANVESIIIENEELRNTLYTEQCTLSNNILRMLTYYSRSSTSEITRTIARMSKDHNIPTTDLYKLVFNMLPKEDDLVTLQDYWGEGYLPIISIYVELIRYTLRFLNPSEVKNMMKKAKLKIKNSGTYTL